MLVLSRKPLEKIIVGEGDSQIEIVVVRLGPNAVRLGITAPKEVRIVRGELIERIDEKAA